MPPLIIVTQDECLTRLPFRIGFFIRTYLVDFYR